MRLFMPDRARLAPTRLLDAEQRLSQRELADALGNRLGKANYCLRVRIEKGQVRVERYRKGNDTTAVVFPLTRSGARAKAELVAIPCGQGMGTR